MREQNTDAARQPDASGRDFAPSEAASFGRHTARGRSAPRLLAADIGGTHARIGLAACTPDRHFPVTLEVYQSYTCNAWPSLAAIFRDFVANHAGTAPVTACAIAVAGYVQGNRLVARNLAWPVRIDTLRQQIGVSTLEVINDFEALAFASQFVPATDTFPVIDARGTAGPTVVVGPGTGLGCAALLPAASGTVLLPSEAGHATLAAGNDREAEVLRWLRRQNRHVDVECALSGPGLANLHQALADIDGRAVAPLEPPQVSAAALQGDDPLAREALSMFCAMLGSFAGDLAILFKASAGIRLASGFLPAIREFLLASEFRTRFLDKGVMQPFLRTVPVRILEQRKLGVVGAAALAARKLRAIPPSRSLDAA